MKWSWRVGQIAGIGIHVHATFLLLIGLYAMSGWAKNRNAIEGVLITFFVLALFGCVILHELGHG